MLFWSYWPRRKRKVGEGSKPSIFFLAPHRFQLLLIADFSPPPLPHLGASVIRLNFFVDCFLNEGSNVNVCAKTHTHTHKKSSIPINCEIFRHIDKD